MRDEEFRRSRDELIENIECNDVDILSTSPMGESNALCTIRAINSNTAAILLLAQVLQELLLKRRGTNEKD